MSKTNDITNAAIRELLANRTYVKATLAINAASAATVKNTGAIIFSVDGVMYTKAALAAQSIAVTHNYLGVAGGAYVQPVSTTVFYVLSLDATGAVSVVQGTFAGQDLSQRNMGTSAKGTGALPDPRDGTAPFGVIKVVTNGVATFTAGTTALDAAGVTATYFDVSILPASL